MSSRYATMFSRLAAADKIAFIPFTVLGDPSREQSLEILRAMVRGGADALELGIPFSDPVADGPVIQAADIRALNAGTTPDLCWELIRTIRAEAAEIPIGLLVYANLAVSGGIENFYSVAAEAGVDSVLIADLPLDESEPFRSAAKAAGIEQVFIAPPNMSDERVIQLAELGGGYTYVVTRRGVTGANESVQLGKDSLLDALKEHHAAPPVYGFGISQPEHVAAAREAGASGAISGSAMVRLIEKHLDQPDKMLAEIEAFVTRMKAATAGGGVQ